MNASLKEMIGAADARYDVVAGYARMVDDTLTAMTLEALRAEREGTKEEAKAARHLQGLAEALHSEFGNVLLRATEDVHDAVNAALPEMSPAEEAHFRAKYGD